MAFPLAACSNGDLTGLEEATATAQQALTLAGPLPNSATFGISVAMDAQTLVVGDHFAAFEAIGPNPIANRGQVHVYTRNGNNWQQLQVLTRGAITASEQHFGEIVILKGNTLLVGAYRDQVVQGGQLGAGDTGAVYRYTRPAPGSPFTLANRLADPALEPGGHFGRFFATNGSLVAIAKGQRGDDEDCPVYVFSTQGSSAQFLYQFDAAEGGGLACIDLAMTDSGVLLAALGESTDGPGTHPAAFRLGQSAATPFFIAFLGPDYEELEASGENVVLLDKDDGGLLFRGILDATGVIDVSSQRLGLAGTFPGLHFEGTHALVSHENAGVAEVLRFTPTSGARIGSAGVFRSAEAEALPNTNTFGHSMASAGLSAAVGNWLGDNNSSASGRVHLMDFPSFHGSLTITDEWFGGYCAELRLTNRGSSNITGWQIVFDARNSTITESWNANFAPASGTVTITSNAGWNSTVAAGAINHNPQVGFCATRTTSDAISATMPLVISSSGTPALAPDGAACTVDGNCGSANCTQGICASAASAARYRFESGTLGWTNIEAPATGTATSTSQAYDGSQSLSLNINGSGNPRVFVAPTPAPPAGTTVTYRIFIPTAAPVTAVQPYIASATWSWSSSWNPITTGMKGSWRTFTATFAAGAATPAREVGVKLYLSASYNGPIFIDAVTW